MSLCTAKAGGEDPGGIPAAAAGHCSRQENMLSRSAINPTAPSIHRPSTAASCAPRETSRRFLRSGAGIAATLSADAAAVCMCIRRTPFRSRPVQNDCDGHHHLLYRFRSQLQSTSCSDAEGSRDHSESTVTVAGAHADCEFPLGTSSGMRFPPHPQDHL